jgi:hypothetical protein
LDREKLVYKVTILINVALRLLDHGLYLCHFVLEILWPTNLYFNPLGLPEVKLRYGQWLHVRVYQALFKNKMLILEILLYLANFCFLLVLGVLA